LQQHLLQASLLHRSKGSCMVQQQYMRQVLLLQQQLVLISAAGTAAVVCSLALTDSGSVMARMASLYQQLAA
jgi:hypothetical protein